MSDELSLRLDLLDRQIVDAGEVPLGRADDLVLEPGAGAPRIAALMVGAQAIGERVSGPLGRTMARVAARQRPAGTPPGPAEIPIEIVAAVSDHIELQVPLADLPHVAGLEHWLSEHVIGPLPGAGHAR